MTARAPVDRTARLQGYHWAAAAWTAVGTLEGVLLFVFFVRNVLR